MKEDTASCPGTIYGHYTLALLFNLDERTCRRTDVQNISCILQDYQSYGTAAQKVNQILHSQPYFHKGPIGTDIRSYRDELTHPNQSANQM